MRKGCLIEYSLENGQKQRAIAWDDDQLKAFKENNKVQVSLMTDDYFPLKDEHDNEIIDLIDKSRLKQVGFINRN
jgi:cytochrome c2